MCLTLSHGHRDTRAQRHTDRILKSAHLTLKLRVSFHSESEWHVPLNSSLLSAPPADRQRGRRKSGKKTHRAEGLDRLNVRQHFNQPAAITQWSWQIYIALIKATASSSFNEKGYLSHTTTCSCNYGSTEWRRRGFTENIAADSAVAFQLKTHQSLAPLFSPGLHRGAAICHMARSHTSCTQCIQYMNRETNKRKKKKKKKTDPGTNVRWHEHSHSTKRANAPTRTHFFFPPELVHSRYSNIKVITRAVRGEREGNGEGERHRESDCCGATLVYFSQFSFLGHRVCVQWVCVCVYSSYYSRYPVELQFRKTQCGSEGDLYLLAEGPLRGLAHVRIRSCKLTHTNTRVSLGFLLSDVRVAVVHFCRWFACGVARRIAALRGV